MIWRITDGILDASWYQKPYSSRRILNFESCHFLLSILKIAQGFFNRAIRLSRESKRDLSINKGVELLKNNDYPL